jgi:hypothetical protein
MGELVATKNYLQRHFLREPLFVPKSGSGVKVVKEDGETTPGITFYEAGLILVGGAREAELRPWYLGTVTEANKISPELRKTIVQTMLVNEATGDRG